MSEICLLRREDRRSTEAAHKTAGIFDRLGNPGRIEVFDCVEAFQREQVRAVDVGPSAASDAPLGGFEIDYYLSVRRLLPFNDGTPEACRSFAS